MTKPLDIDQVMQLIQGVVTEEGTRSAAARRIGVSPVYLGEVLNGKELPGPKILKYFGLDQEIVYVKK